MIKKIKGIRSDVFIGIGKIPVARAITRNKILINRKYQGSDAIAITKCNKMYDVMGAINRQDLTEHLNKSRNTYSEFQVIKVYDGVDLSKAYNKLAKVARELQAGKILDLERILK